MNYDYFGEPRESVLEDLKFSTADLPPSAFFGHLLPKTGFCAGDQLLSRLEEDETIVSGGWKSILELFDSSRSNSSEAGDEDEDEDEDDMPRDEEMFFAIKDAVEAINRANTKLSKERPLVSFDDWETRTNGSEDSEYDSEFELDAGFYLNNPVQAGAPVASDVSCSNSGSSDPPSIWDAIACPWEFADDGDVKENEQRLLCKLDRIMSDDPRRRFVFGVTIESTTMRIWFACRSFLTVTGFDYMEAPMYLIQMVVALSFSSMTDLGFDPTVRLRQDGQYDISCGDQIYVTTRILANHGAQDILSRGCRAFEARLLGNPNSDLFVIKSYWMDETRLPEDVVIKQVLDDFQSALDVTETPLKGVDKNSFRWLESHIRRPDVVEEVRICDLTDSTRNLCKELDFSSYYAYKKVLPDVLWPISYLGGRGGTTELVRVPKSMAEVRHRIHYRMVFGNVANSLTMPSLGPLSLGDSFKAISDVSRVIYLMAIAGWVHRNTSCGSIYSKCSEGLLGDFECAQRMGSITTHGERWTGTPAFMAVDVFQTSYHYSPTCEAAVSKSREDRMPNLSPPFKHHPVHDMESLWWNSIWLLIEYGPRVSSSGLRCFQVPYQYRLRLTLLRLDEKALREEMPKYGGVENYVLGVLPKVSECLSRSYHIVAKAACYGEEFPEEARDYILRVVDHFEGLNKTLNEQFHTHCTCNTV